MFVLLLARTAHFETFNRVRENRIHSLLTQPQPPHLASELSKAYLEVLRHPALSSRSLHSNMCLSVLMPFENSSASLLLAWLVSFSYRNQLRSTVTFFFFLTSVTWHTWLFCKDMKSLLISSQLMKLVLDALSYHWTFHFTLYDIRLKQYDGLHNVTPYKPLSAAIRGHSAKNKIKKQ